MSAFNVVRMRVKPEFVDEVLRYYRDAPRSTCSGMKALTAGADRRAGLLADRRVGRIWTRIAAARPAMIASLDEHPRTSSRISAAGSASPTRCRATPWSSAPA